MNYLLLILTFIITLGARSQYSGLPITLSIPYDQDTIEETEPTFVWQANLEAIQSDPRLTQQIVVAEIAEDQTPSEAIALNVPVFIRQELQTNSIAYSSTDYEMLKNVWYAWQVSYVFNGTVVQQSEVWKFINAEEIPARPSYLTMRKQEDGSIFLFSGTVLNVCLSERPEVTYAVRLRMPDGSYEQPSFTELINDQPISEENPSAYSDTRFFSIDLTNITAEGAYTLELISSDNQSHVLTFQRN